MQFKHITCPRCGLLCDDLDVSVNDQDVTLDDNSHSVCKQFFVDAKLTDKSVLQPRINGKPCTLNEAVAHAAKLHTTAKQSIISGLIADVQACRSAFALAEKTHSVIDHANGQSMRASTAIMQRYGEVRTTLAEARNRADCIVLFGAEILTKFPRLRERILQPAETISGNTDRKIIIIDVVENTDLAADEEIEFFHLPLPNLEAAIQQLQYLASPRASAETEIEPAIRSIHQQISESNYAVLTWTASLFAKNTAEQTLQNLTFFIKESMKTQRCVGLPLSGSRGEITANQVSTWQTGFPLPVAFSSGAPEHNPVIYNAETMLTNSEADLLTWISTYSSDDTPKQYATANIVIGHPNMQCDQTVDVFIPVGIPGVDQRGLACRTDAVATLPLHSIRKNDLPSADHVLNLIYQAL